MSNSSRFAKGALIFVLASWSLLGYLYLRNKARLADEREGYQRGAEQGAFYFSCTGHAPTEGFKEEMWNMVGYPHDCRFVQAIEETGTAKLKRRQP